MEPTSVCFLRAFGGFGLEALEVLGSIDVLRGCEMPGVFDAMAEGVVLEDSRPMPDG
jgi:hypothetical protein